MNDIKSFLRGLWRAMFYHEIKVGQVWEFDDPDSFKVTVRDIKRGRVYYSFSSPTHTTNRSKTMFLMLYKLAG